MPEDPPVGIADVQTVAFPRVPAQLYEALALANLEFPEIHKDATADIQSRKEGARSYRYTYATLAEIMRAIRVPLAKQGLVVVHPIEGDELVTRLAHKSGEYLESRLRLSMNYGDVKGLGIEISYFRRYMVQALVGIAPDDESDKEAEERMQELLARSPAGWRDRDRNEEPQRGIQQPRARQAPPEDDPGPSREPGSDDDIPNGPPASALAEPGQRVYIENLAKRKKVPLEEAMAAVGVKKFETLTQDGFIAMKEWLASR